MKNFLEMRNLLKYLIKGSSLEPLARGISNIVLPRNKVININKRDDASTIQIMNRVLTKHSNCLDVGCNTGDFLIPISQFATFGYHYAFEPIPRLANRLRKKFPTVDIREVALSDSEKETTFWYVVNSPATSSLKKQICESRSPNALMEPITVKTQKLDDILPPEFKVNFIKMDVEGAELQVLKGAIRTLKNHKPYIVFEHGKIASGEDCHDGKHDERIYDLLVKHCGMQIFELSSWLEGLAPLKREEFAKSYFWNFLATP